MDVALISNDSLLTAVFIPVDNFILVLFECFTEVLFQIAYLLRLSFNPLILLLNRFDKLRVDLWLQNMMIGLGF